MGAPAATVPAQRPRGIPLNFVLVFGAALTALTLLDDELGAPDAPAPVRRALKANHYLLPPWIQGDAKARKKAKKKAKILARQFETAPAKRKKKMAIHRKKARKKKEAKQKTKWKKAMRKEAAENAALEAAENAALGYSETTASFFPVLTKLAFGDYVDTFRSTLHCFHENGLYLLPTGGTLVGTLRHQGMIPWDDHIDVYYFVRDGAAILDVEGPVQKCLKRRGIKTSFDDPPGSSRTNLRFEAHGNRRLSAFPAYHEGDNIAFASRSIEGERSTMARSDVFPLREYPFHDYRVHLPLNIKKYLEEDWSGNHPDHIKIPTLDSLMRTVVSEDLRHAYLHGCKRRPAAAHLADVEYLRYYDPTDPLRTLPFRPHRCWGRVPREYEEYVRARRRVGAGAGAGQSGRDGGPR